MDKIWICVLVTSNHHHYDTMVISNKGLITFHLLHSKGEKYYDVSLLNLIDREILYDPLQAKFSTRDINFM